MVGTNIPKRTIMGIIECCFGSVLSIVVCFVIFELYGDAMAENASKEASAISLPNENCDTRPTLITVGAVAGDYYPMVISLHKCDGVCGEDRPTFRACVPDKTNTIYLNALNKLTLKNETLTFENHTSCACRCVFDNTVCSETQIFDENQCKCVCADSQSHSICSINYIWNPRYCKCECDLSCNNKQTLNATSCGCDCNSKYYKRCSRKNKILRESDCKCYDYSAPSKKDCSKLPTKWQALIIIVSVCGIIIIAFDCILYCKSTGFVYKSTHMCLKDHHNVELRSQHETSVSDDMLDFQGKGVKV